MKGPLPSDEQAGDTGPDVFKEPKSGEITKERDVSEWLASFTKTRDIVVADYDKALASVLGNGDFCKNLIEEVHKKLGV